MLCYKFITLLLRFCYIFVKKKLQLIITFLLQICCIYITFQRKNFVRILQEKNCKIKLFYYFKNQIEIHFKFKIEISIIICYSISKNQKEATKVGDTISRLNKHIRLHIQLNI